ncbi:MAG: hypothetical protein ACRDG3_12640, partial [Tepidiformaceae bacterium]
SGSASDAAVPLATQTLAATAPLPSAAAVNPTATPIPGKVSAPAQGWFLQYVELDAQGSEFPSGSGTVTTLDLEYKTVPFPDFKDDMWLVRANGSVHAVQSGHQQFVLEIQGDVTVSIGGRVVAQAIQQATPRLFAVRFDSPAGDISVSITARDRSGPFVLRWVG